MRISTRFLLLLSFILLAATICLGQDACPPLSAPPLPPGASMFSEQQEVDLGDAQAEELRQTITIVSDPALTGYLQAIVDRLALSLSPGQLRFRAALVEEPTADAFSVAGGRIYVSRKLVSFVRNEDELAAILAHEMGHSLAHHEAMRMTAALHQLGVSQLGDRDDVIAKWNLYLDNYRRRKSSMSDYLKAWKLEQQEQIEADKVALVLVQRAGYSTRAFGDVFDRLAETRGNTGNFLSDLFGATPPDAKRLRQMTQSAPQVPSTCVARRDNTETAVTAWQKLVIEYSDNLAHENLPGLISKRALTEHLRPEIQQIRISHDGKYVMAQDPSNIFVLTRSPFQVLFRIDAAEARSAQFTPDSKAIVFDTVTFNGSPRVEQWSIATRQRTAVHEIYLRDGCTSTSLSPDGKFLACHSYGASNAQVFGAPLLGLTRETVNVFDTQSGASIWERKDVRSLPKFSPDGRYMVVRVGESAFCLELTTRNEIHLPGNVKNLITSGNFVFLPNGRLMGLNLSTDKAQVVEFPSGQVVHQSIQVGRTNITPAADPGYVLLSLPSLPGVSVLDLEQNKIVLGSKRRALDIFAGSYIAERTDADLQIFDLATMQGGEQARIPDAQLGYITTATVSPDLGYLAISELSRGAVWNLATGDRLFQVRGFTGGYFAGDGSLYAVFPKFEKTDRALVRMSLKTSTIDAVMPLEESDPPKPRKATLQVGPYLATLVFPDSSQQDLGRAVLRGTWLSGASSMELRNVTDQKVLWTQQLVGKGLERFWANANLNSLVLEWSVESEAFNRMKEQDAQLAAAMARYKSGEGIELLEVLELDTGKRKARLLIDTGKNSFWISRADAAGNSVILSDNQKRVLVYSFSGEQRGIIPGHTPIIAPGSQLVAVRTERGVVELYDLATLKRQCEYDFSRPPALIEFSGDGKRLLVLSSDQTVYTLEVRPGARTASLRDGNTK